MIKSLALRLAFITLASDAQAQAPNGPPPGFFPQGAEQGDLWVEFCYIGNRACTKTEVKAWGSVCNSATADNVVFVSSKNASYVGVPTGAHYVGWHCSESGPLIKPDQKGGYLHGKFMTDDEVNIAMVNEMKERAAAYEKAADDEKKAKQTAEADEKKLGPHTTLYTQTFNGKIAITHNLSIKDCNDRKNQALGQAYATKEESAAAAMFNKQNDPCQGARSCSWVSTSPTAAEVSIGNTAYTRVGSDIRNAVCLDKPLQ